MLMSKDNDIVSCVLLHLEDLTEKRINEHWITEENMNTIQGKYWNRHWANIRALTQEEIDEIKLSFLTHCYLRHDGDIK